MALNDNLKILQDSLDKARKYNEDKNYGRSFAHYLIVFQLLKPELRQKYEKEFTNVLHIWGSILHNRKQFEDIFKCYNLAILYFPCSPDILNNFGVHALKLKNYKLAKTYFEKSLNNDPEFLPAEQNLQTTNFMLVERWHFPMLNDIQRNRSYGEAIFSEISNGFRDVLDIGTGTGILSLFASKCRQIRTISACDYSETMCDIAVKVFRENNATNIKLLKKSSMDLEVPNDLNKRATLLVTEILDSGVFGENILETLIHAWDHLLFSIPYAKIIPASVNIYITGVQSDNLSRKIRLNQRNMPLNLDKMCLAFLPIPYDTENLKYENVCYVTDTQLALKVNFNNVQQLKQLLDRNNILDIKLNSMKCGRIDAFVLWFKLFLNESVSITNDPFSGEDSCWEQAVFYLHHPLSIRMNDEINIKMSCSKGYIDIMYNEIVCEHTCFLIPKNAILFLNDSILMEYLQDVHQAIQSKYKNVSISVLDLTPFPVLALQLLANKTATRITCKVEESVQQVIYKLCELNSIEKEGIYFVDDYDCGEEKYDIIVQNFINPCGLLNEEEIYNSAILKYNLSESGLYIPDGVCVYAQLVQCEWLKRSTKVFDENCCGFKIADFINEYKSTEQRDINLNIIPHIKLTDAIELGPIKTSNIFDVSFTQKTCKITQNGWGNAIFYWYEIKLVDGKRINTRRNNSFCNNASFILDTHKQYKINDNLKLVLKQHRGIIKIHIEK